jgi:hypothetical protein
LPGTAQVFQNASVVRVAYQRPSRNTDDPIFALPSVLVLAAAVLAGPGAVLSLKVQLQ